MPDFRREHFRGVHVKYDKRNSYGKLSDQVQDDVEDDGVWKSFCGIAIIIYELRTVVGYLLLNNTL